ncbi:hypothetical protein, partial [Klebsiella pneumoniae]|uniref:hypothetical protein n=1 Tax=Klebsiella pneumoniae TaxID=573 RepID=UPI001D0EDAEB
GLTALSAEFTIGEGELMAHDVPLGCAPDEYDDLISGTCSHLPLSFFYTVLNFILITFYKINAIATPYFLSVISEIIIIIVINKDNVIARICVIIINIVAMNDDNLAIGV